VALSLLRAVEEGRGEDADRFASELASLVLNEDRVALALAVRGGGPLRITRAIRLAEDTLTDLEGASAEDLAGAGKGGT
jgi:hypothetical protein